MVGMALIRYYIIHLIFEDKHRIVKYKLYASKMVYEIRYKKQTTGTNQYAKSRHSCIPIFNLKEGFHQMFGMVYYIHNQASQ